MAAERVAMKRLTYSMGAFLIVALALMGEVSTAKNAEASCVCPSFTGYETEILTATAAGCGTALTNLKHDTNAAAWAACGDASLTCLGTLVVTEECVIGSPSPSVSGYRNYNCKICS
jgi:hypothetical protein